MHKSGENGRKDSQDQFALLGNVGSDAKKGHMRGMKEAMTQLTTVVY